MPFGFKLSHRLARIRKTLTLISISAVLTQCEAVTAPYGADNPNSSGQPAPKPAAITDLTVSSTTDTSTIVSFTEVDNGNGQPASYEIRYGVAPRSWAVASSVVDGTCANPNTGTAIGNLRTCSVYGLTPSTAYDIMVGAFRGTYAASPVLGPPSPAITFATEVAIASIVVTPESLATMVGQAVQLTATPEDSSGTALNDRRVVWSSDDTTFLRVDSTGRVTSTQAGAATITASAGRHRGRTHITVLAHVASVTISPVSVTNTVGQTAQLTVTVRDAHNSVLTGRVVSWSSSNPVVATVTATGLVTAVGAGSATITATSEGISGQAQIAALSPPVSTVAVSPSAASSTVGQTVQFTATLRDAGNTVLTGRAVAWSSGNPAVATIDATGLATTVAPGSTTITATSEGRSGQAQLTTTVLPAPVATVAVSPATASPTVGQTTQFTTTLRDANNNVLTGRVVTWSTSNPAVTTVNGAGLGTAVGTGSATVTATSEGKSGQAQVTASAPPAGVATVTVSPTAASSTVGQATQFAASLKDTSGNVLTGRPVTWTSSNTTVATINTTGLATAVGAGSATITATSEGISGQAQVTAVPAVATVTVSPSTAGPTVGQTTQFTATLRDASSIVLTARVVTWSSSNSTVATVSTAGLAAAIGVGSATITASSEGVQGVASIVVAGAPPVATITAPTSSQVLAAGTTSTTLSVTTDKTATCRWSTTDQTYGSMANTFASTGGTSHSTTLSGLANGTGYTRYIRCQDSTGSPMTTSQSITFSVAALPPALFQSDWSTAVGTSDAALRDVGKTVPWTNVWDGHAILAVVPATGRGFPAGMSNILQVKRPANSAFFGFLQASRAWNTLAVGSSLYYRVYIRVEYANSEAASNGSSHDLVQSARMTPWEWHWGNAKNGTFPVYLLWRDNNSPNTNWYINTGNPGTNLNKNATYRWEWAVTRTANGYRVAVRIYDNDDRTLLYANGGNTQMKNIDGSKTLATWDDANIVRTTEPVLDHFEIGDNGGQTFTTDQFHYFGGVCIRADTWCGAY